jgi:hypothetical protein
MSASDSHGLLIQAATGASEHNLPFLPTAAGTGTKLFYQWLLPVGPATRQAMLGLGRVRLALGTIACMQNADSNGGAARHHT